MLSSKKMYLKALLSVTTDLPKLWDKIQHYNRVNLGGEDGRYIVYFNGEISDGLEVLKTLLSASDAEIQISTTY